ncbi:hypothetical protein BC831DRAFT_451697 [Entophlyctis helioformis]|nr:hypothetical protein BC831DRAFT_451697 [Entophlyctis helioformis]
MHASQRLLSSTSLQRQHQPRQQDYARLSRLLLPTAKSQDAALKASPSQAQQPQAPQTQTSSYDLLLRGGFIRPSTAAGIYSILPFGLRVLSHLERIIDDEMSAPPLHGLKLSLPCLLSSDAWKLTGRWESTGPEMFKVNDRKDAEFLLSPTHEEEVTSLVAGLVSSYRQLPLRVYQIGRKYRDELRPRSGLLRAREFIMKDMYSFDASEEDALETYRIVQDAYVRILQRVGVPFAVAEADTGNIGGTRSHEYHFVSAVGEDTLLSCSSCGYAANEEQAIAAVRPSADNPVRVPPNALGAIDASLSVPAALETLARNSEGLALDFYSVVDEEHVETHAVTVLMRHDRRVNPLRLKKMDDFKGFHAVRQAASADTLSDLASSIVVIDESVGEQAASSISSLLASLDAKVAASNRVVQGSVVVAVEGDACPSCSTPTKPPAHITPSTPAPSSSLVSARAIEVGHTFYLGTKYSIPLSASFNNAAQSTVPLVMGCFGLGVSRMIAAVVEACHDAKGIIWPRSIAPYEVCVIPLRMPKRPDAQSLIDAHVDVVVDALAPHVLYGGRSNIVVDDRDAQFGFKMNDAALVGYPYVVVIGRSFVEHGKVEMHCRADGSVKMVDAAELGSLLAAPSSPASSL